MADPKTELVPRNKIIWPEEQERKYFGHEELASLAETMKVHGILEPITVIRDGERYRGLFGQRRWLAAELAGIEWVPALVREQAPSDLDAMEIRIIENSARASLLPVEQATALDQMMKLRGWSAGDLAKRIGLKASAVSKALSLIALPDSIKKQIDAGAIGATAGYELAKLDDLQLQADFAGKVARGELGRDALAGIVKAARKGTQTAKAVPASRVTIRLSASRSVSIRGGDRGVEGAIKTLEELLSRLRPARAKGLSLTTVIRMLNDESK